MSSEIGKRSIGLIILEHGKIEKKEQGAKKKKQRKKEKGATREGGPGRGGSKRSREQGPP